MVPVAHEPGDDWRNIRVRVASAFVVKVMIVDGETEALGENVCRVRG